MSKRFGSMMRTGQFYQIRPWGYQAPAPASRPRALTVADFQQLNFTPNQIPARVQAKRIYGDVQRRVRVTNATVLLFQDTLKLPRTAWLDPLTWDWVLYLNDLPVVSRRASTPRTVFRRVNMFGSTSPMT